MLKIGIKFCGHCAPRMDMMEVYRDLREAAPQWEYVYYMKDQDVDLLLILNACHAQCAAVPEFDGPVVIVSPDSVDHWPVGDRPLSHVIREQILRIAMERIGGATQYAYVL